ncbi:tetratricopeptide repeat protein [Gammaproteobacteria bacterium LSUCC0112]|nr:tetratricopeptide repeat protein [Gammaproteobacteria bacterium LSUCC0112]
MKNLHLQLLILLSPIMVACSTLIAPDGDATQETAISPESTVSAATESSVVVEEEPVEYGNFTLEQLEIALLSELGGMRGYLPQAAEGYYELALETGDLNIIRRASEFVSASGNTEALNQLAKLWTSKDPQAMEPHLLLGYQLMEEGLYGQALPHLAAVMELGGQVDFTAMSARTYTLENRQRAIIISQLQDMVTRHPDEPTLYFAIAQMYDQSSMSEQAAQWLQTGREKFGDSPRTYLIEAQLLQNMGRAEQAETVLISAVKQYPDHRLLRYSLAQLLVQNNKLAEAALEFEYIMQREPRDFETLYSLVLINLELEEYNKAEPRLRELIGAGHRMNEANYYLAIILEDRNAIDEAINRYQQINRQSNAYLTAQRQILRLLVQLERFQDAKNWSQQLANSDARLAPVMPTLEAEALMNADQNERARDVLDQALSSFPDNIDLLFARALLAERFDDMALVEQDLRRIIDLDPQNARALNHLGYAMTLRTDRYQEAIDLISRALAVTPDDPAIIDSLGWVQYKLGLLDESIVNLRRAYALFPDHEVAAHLGEVLWVNGQLDEAIDVWETSLEEFPNSEFIMEAMRRLIPADADVIQPEQRLSS